MKPDTVTQINKAIAVMRRTENLRMTAWQLSNSLDVHIAQNEAELHTLRAEKGPADGSYDTWKQAAVVERKKRVALERSVKRFVEQPATLSSNDVSYIVTGATDNPIRTFHKSDYKLASYFIQGYRAAQSDMETRLEDHV